MTAADKQIVTMYEELQCTPAQIVDELNGEYDIEAVKMCLLNHSAQFKQEARQAVQVSNGGADQAQGIFSEEERQIAKSVCLRLCQFSEAESVQARMAEVILNEQRAERTSQKLTALAGAKMNILQFQEHANLAKAAIQRARQAQVIDISDTNNKLQKVS
jgi:hypothetical protein